MTRPSQPINNPSYPQSAPPYPSEQLPLQPRHQPLHMLKLLLPNPHLIPPRKSQIRPLKRFQRILPKISRRPNPPRQTLQILLPKTPCPSLDRHERTQTFVHGGVFELGECSCCDGG